MRCLALAGIAVVGCAGHGMTKLEGASTVGVPAAVSGSALNALLGAEIQKRHERLTACFAGPTNVDQRAEVKVAFRGPLHEGPGSMPGAYSGWGRPDAVFYVGQLPERPGAAQPVDDDFNRCLASALEKIPFPMRETHAVDATWTIRYQAGAAKSVAAQ